MWRGIVCFLAECGPGIFEAVPSRMGGVGEGTSSLPGLERHNGPTIGCV